MFFSPPVLKYKDYTVNHIFTSSLKIMPYLFGYSSYGLHGLSFSPAFRALMLYDYVPLALTCYDLFTVSWMRVNGTHIFFWGGGEAPFAFIRFCGKTANLSDIVPHHRIDKHKSSHTGWALVLHFFSLCQRLQICLIYLEQMHAASSRYSSSVLPDSKVRPCSTARFTQSLFNPCS